MIASILLRTAAFGAFLGLGIAWMADHDTVVATLWVIAFAVAALLTIWYALTDEARAGLSQVGDLVPWPSKDHRDYL
jgi:hypothetical protein